MPWCIADLDLISRNNALGNITSLLLHASKGRTRHLHSFTPRIQDPAMFSTPLCQVCQSIDFDKAFCCPGDGGAPFQTWGSLRASAHSGCELCILIEREHDEHGRKGLESDEKMLCCVWNYYEGEKERFRGSARIIFFNSSQAIRLGIFVDEGDGFLSSYSSVKC